MSDAGPMSDDRALVAALAQLRFRVEFPPTPDLASSVREAILGEAQRVAGPLFGGWRTLARGLALGVLAAAMVAGVTVALGIAFGGLRIGYGEKPPDLPSNVIITRAFGHRVTMSEALEELTFRPFVPELEELGEPDYVYVIVPPAGGSLSLVWKDRPDFPAGADGLGVVVTQFVADIDSQTAGKLLSEGVAQVVVELGNGIALWVEGGRHYFFYTDAEGNPIEGSVRLVGDALIWEQDGLTLRIEGAGSLDEALRIAKSLQPAT